MCSSTSGNPSIIIYLFIYFSRDLLPGLFHYPDWNSLKPTAVSLSRYCLYHCLGISFAFLLHWVLFPFGSSYFFLIYLVNFGKVDSSESSWEMRNTKYQNDFSYFFSLQFGICWDFFLISDTVKIQDDMSGVGLYSCIVLGVCRPFQLGNSYTSVLRNVW